MNHLVTTSQMREIDRRTIEEVGIPGLLLMENAGLETVRVVKDLLNTLGGNRIQIFCGTGNNGGDGFVVARHLFNHGYDISIFLVGEKSRIKGDARVNLQITEQMGLVIHPLLKKGDLKRISLGDITVDALLGTGISGKVTGLMATVIHWINEQSVPVVSVDVPSGLHCDDGSFEGACIHADKTVTMGELKIGLTLPPGREMAGEVTVADIGVPPQVSKSLRIKTCQLEMADIRDLLPVRSEDGHKGDFGKVLILAGSTGMTGAAVLASKACLRAGAGLVILGIPSGLNTVLEEKLTEVMTKPLPETREGTLSMEALNSIERLLEWADILVVGPGISTFSETSELVRRIITNTSLPVVLDADGLNAFSGYGSLLEQRSNLILTPHYGELSRLIDLPIEEIRDRRIEVARQTASRFGSVVILKGSPTVIADSEDFVFINSTGNSGMATGGTGDVLTGTVAGFLAQGSSLLDAALIGVYIHGLSGDLAGQAIGQRSMIAGDLLNYLCNAIRLIENQPETDL